MSASISTHVLDAVHGRPATGLRVALETSASTRWTPIGSDVTDADGRISALGSGLAPGAYRLTFATGPWFAAAFTETFYPEVVLSVTIGSGHHHVPLLLSPFAYSTYRGT